MSSDEDKQLASRKLMIVTEAHRTAMARMAELEKMQTEITEKLQPTIDAMNRVVNSPGFVSAMGTVAKASRVAAEAAEAITRNLDISELTRLLNSIDVRPFIADSLAPRFPIPQTELVWNDDVIEGEESEPLKEATEEVISIIQDRVTESNEKAFRLTLVIKRNGTLQHPEYVERSRVLPPKLVALASALERESLPTSHFTKKSGYLNDKTTRQQFNKLNHIGFGALQLPVKIAIHDEEAGGYRLPKGLRIKVEK